MHKQAFVEISCAREKIGKYSLWWSQEMRIRERGLQTCFRNNLNPDAFNLWPMPIFIFRESGGWTSISLFRLCSKENWAIIQYSYIQHVPGMRMYLPWSHFVFNFWARNEIFSSQLPGGKIWRLYIIKGQKLAAFPQYFQLQLSLFEIFSSLVIFCVPKLSGTPFSVWERALAKNSRVRLFYTPCNAASPYNFAIHPRPALHPPFLFVHKRMCVFVCIYVRSAENAEIKHIGAAAVLEWTARISHRWITTQNKTPPNEAATQPAALHYPWTHTRAQRQCISVLVCLYVNKHEYVIVQRRRSARTKTNALMECLRIIWLSLSRSGTENRGIGALL